MIDFSQMVTAEQQEAERRDGLTSSVDNERDKRTSHGFVHGGVLYQARPKDIANINGAALAASMAISTGAAAAGLRWSDPYNDFAWIAADDSKTPMDAYQMVAFGLAAMSHVSAMTMRARAIKDRILAGEVIDITQDSEWAES